MFNNLNFEQQQQIDELQQYLQKHKINLLFEVNFLKKQKELLANLIQDQAPSPRKAILEYLKSYKTTKYYNDHDFETLFTYYDFLEEKTTKTENLIEGIFQQIMIKKPLVQQDARQREQNRNIIQKRLFFKTSLLMY
ncbi:hypothetical protein pb186bvf_013068 [Paramecium bursaria]